MRLGGNFADSLIEACAQKSQSAYSLAVGTADQLVAVTLGSIERRVAMASISSFCGPTCWVRL